MAGTYLESAVSSFLAESIALDEAISFARRLLERGVRDEPVGKLALLRFKPCSHENDENDDEDDDDDDVD
eukprot:9051022-Karenia_brevis.AAC.1